jgi:hypothetical protein
LRGITATTGKGENCQHECNQGHLVAKKLCCHESSPLFWYCANLSCAAPLFYIYFISLISRIVKWILAYPYYLHAWRQIGGRFLCGGDESDVPSLFSLQVLLNYGVEFRGNFSL